ncbi:hypothetical protein DFH29DRAFT_1008282 [Suillus ampliporus]|nr:hypothetical protein DFH29DRAFT_1008282 [Suillus ampliporus]
MADMWKQPWDLCIVHPTWGSSSAQLSASNPTTPTASKPFSKSIPSTMDSKEHPIDKARRLQDERIKADRNYFVTWDQWVPPKLWTTPSPQKDGIPMKRPNTSTPSLMPSNKTPAERLAKQCFGHETFDMCWSTETDQLPTVETPTMTSSAEPHFGCQTFDMCWDTEVDPVPILSVETARPAATGQYNLCWDDEPHPSKVHLPPIVQLPTFKTPPVDVAIPLAASQYDMCWDDQPSPSAVTYKANFDMCWDDSPSVKNDDLDIGPTTAGVDQSVIGSVESAADTIELSESSTGGYKATFDMCWGDPSSGGDNDLDSGPTTALAIQSVNSAADTIELPENQSTLSKIFKTGIFRTGEELLRQANMRLENIDTVIADDQGQSSKDIIHAHRDLISAYQDARCGERTHCRPVTRDYRGLYK